MKKSEILKTHYLQTIEKEIRREIKKRYSQHIDLYVKYPATYYNPGYWQPDPGQIIEAVMNSSRVIKASDYYARHLIEEMTDDIKSETDDENASLAEWKELRKTS